MTDKSVEQGKGEAEANPAQTANETDDLDALLASFDDESGEQQTATQTAQTTTAASQNGLEAKVDELLQAHQASQREKEQTATREAIDTAVGWMKDVAKEAEADLPEGADDILEGVLQTAAMKDPRIYNAFTNRHKAPSAWKKIVIAKAQDVVKLFPKANQDSQREKVAAAVAQSRSGQNKDQGPTAEELGQMSDREFEKHKRSLLGQTGPY